MKVLIATAEPALEHREIVYNSLDTINTLSLHKKLSEDLKTDIYARDTYYYMQKILGPMMTMIRRGIKVDEAKRRKVARHTELRLKRLQLVLDRFARALWGKGLNPASPLQVKTFFLEWLCVPEGDLVSRKKGESKITTDSDKLESLAEKHLRCRVFCNLILRIRELKKQVEVLNSELYDGRFLSTYNVAGTETLRLSCSQHPFWCGGNAQNIDRDLRNFFVADEGYTFVQCDQQGAEARGVAYLSGDENYIAAVNSNDVHTLVASMTYGFPNEREYSERMHPAGRTPSDTYRQVTKATTHGSNYYGTPWTIGRQAGIPTAEAETFQFKYFRKFPGIKSWHKWNNTNLQRHGFIINPFGFKRRFWDRPENDSTLREAIANGPQSMVGIITNIGLYKLWLEYEGKPERDVLLLANGHDAAIVQIRTEKLAELMPRVTDLLTITIPVADINGKVREMTIPIEAETGPSWGKKEMTKWKA